MLNYCCILNYLQLKDIGQAMTENFINLTG